MGAVRVPWRRIDRGSGGPRADRSRRGAARSRSLKRKRMRYLLLSDIHSNDEALSAVLSRVRRKKFDRVVDPRRLRRLRREPQPGPRPDPPLRRKKVLIRGNHDKVVCGLDAGELFNPIALAARWMDGDRLTPQNRRFLETLPARARLGGRCIRDLPRLSAGRGRLHLLGPRRLHEFPRIPARPSASSGTATSRRSSRSSPTASASRSWPGSGCG